MSLEFWAQISTVWLALLCFIAMLVPLAASYFAVRGMHAALGKSRSVFETAQTYSSRVRRSTEAVSDKISAPVIKAGAQASRTNEVLRRLADDIDN